MKNLVLVMLCSLSVLNTWGQLTPTVTPVVDQFGIVKSMNSKPLKQKGSIYLNEEWLPSTIYFKKGVFATDKIENVPIKLDLMTNTIEVKTQEGIKVLLNSSVDKFEWFNPGSNALEVYVNCTDFTLDGTKMNSFCGIYGDKVKLVEHNYVEVQKADYNVALDVGSKEDRIIKKSKLYLVKDKELLECTKKSVYVAMADQEDKIKQFVKKNHLDFRKEKDLRAVIDYYDSNL